MTGLAEESYWELATSARYLWILIPAVMVCVYFLYKKEKELDSPNRKIMLGGLRVSAIVILLILLFEPRRVTETEIGSKSPFLIFVDKSVSMKTKGTEYDDKEKKIYIKKFGKNYAKISRFEQQRQLVSELKEKLDDTHNVRVVGFGSSFNYFSDQVSWDATNIEKLDKRTRLSESLRLAVSEIRGEAISGMAIFSDGNIEDVEASKSLLDMMKKQIHKDMKVETVGIGSATIKSDVKLLSFSIPEIVIKSKDTVTFRATFSGRGLTEDQSLELKLFQDDVEVVDQRKIVSLADKEVVYEVVLNQAGKFKYKLQIETINGETLLENNSRTAFVTVKDEKLKILYIEDFPRHDYRKLSQFLVRNEALYETRIWLNRAQPDYKQLGTKNKGLKQSPLITYSSFDSLWKAADVIFIGNIGSRPFESSNFLLHLEKFVERGGGLVFLAGPNNMPSSYASNEIVSKLMPVYFDHATVKSDGGKLPFSFEVTNRGSKHPITRMEGPDVTKQAWKGLPKCQWFYRPLGLKASTQVLIQHPEETLAIEPDRKVPLFAVMPYGKGQVFYLGTDEASRWSYLDGNEYMFNHFIGQLVQYMSSSKVRVGGVLEVDSDQIPLGDEINVTLHLEDPSETTDQIKFVKWSYDKGPVEKMELKRQSANSSVFEGELEPQEKGIVHVWLKDKASAQQVSVTGFSREMEANELNENNLRMLSSRDKTLSIDKLQDMAQNFTDNQVKKTEQKTESLLDSKRGEDKSKKIFIFILLGVLSVILGMEWWLRKRWHLL